jgi:polysaccharide chain length determinant protein (PEP-CTERM system associated)
MMISQNPADFFEVLRPRWPQIAILMVIPLVIAVGLALGLPEVYRATATILIEQPEIPDELVASLETSPAERRLRSLTAHVLTQKRLTQLTQELDLYPSENEESEPGEAESRLYDSITVEPVTEEIVNPRIAKIVLVTTSFTVSYDHKSPQKAQQVVARLADWYLEEDRKSRSSQRQDTSAFLEGELNKIKEHVAEQEQRLAEFKRANIGLLPEFAYANQQQVEATKQQIDQVQRTIASLQETKGYLETQVNSNDALAVARAELAAAQQRYSDIHPDVIRLKNTVKQLESDQRKGIKPTYAGSPEEESGNRVLQATLQNTAAQLKENRVLLAQLQDKLASLQADLAKAPEIERQFLALQRNYQRTVQQYDQMNEKRGRAELAQQLDETEMAEHLSLLGKPAVPSAPVSPNRPAILLLGFVAGLGMSLGYAFLVLYTDRTVRGARGLANALGAPPIGLVPYIFNAQELRRRRTAIMASVVIAVVVVLILAYLGYVYWLPVEEVQVSSS